MGLSRNIFFRAFATSCCNRRLQIIIVIKIEFVGYSITDRGAECNRPRPIPESGAITFFIYFLFFVFGRKCRVFFSLFFGPKMIFFSVFFIFRPKKENPCMVGLYSRLFIRHLRLLDFSRPMLIVSAKLK